MENPRFRNAIEEKKLKITSKNERIVLKIATNSSLLLKIVH